LWITAVLPLQLTVACSIQPSYDAAAAAAAPAALPSNNVHFQCSAELEMLVYKFCMQLAVVAAALCAHICMSIPAMAICCQEHSNALTDTS
jgi:hypothetical protein